jgi:hypothetical protein
MSLPLLEGFESRQTEARQRQEATHALAITANRTHAWERETEQLMRSNGHTQQEIDRTLANGPPPPSPEARPKGPQKGPVYTPGQTILGGGVTPGTRKADEESGSGGLEGTLTKLTNPARETGQETAEDAEKVKASIHIPNPLSWTTAIANVFTKLAEGSFWMRVLKFVLGTGLLIIALVFFARAAGLGAPDPAAEATQAASQAIVGHAKSNRQRQGNVSDSTRRKVQKGVSRETERDYTERSKTGKPLSGGALTQRQRAQVRRRDAALPSTRELVKGAKRR